MPPFNNLFHQNMLTELHLTLSFEHCFSQISLLRIQINLSWLKNLNYETTGTIWIAQTGKKNLGRVFNLFRNLSSSTSPAPIEKWHPSPFPSHSLLFGYEIKNLNCKYQVRQEQKSDAQDS